MEAFYVVGPCRLSGNVRIHGAKNSVLPLLAASLLCRESCELTNCPDLSDVHTALAILQALGAPAQREKDRIVLSPWDGTVCEIPEELMRRMRSSIIFLWAILARAGEAALSLPGGCELGPRPVDLHLQAMRALGATVREDHGKIRCEAPGGLKGAQIVLAFPSVGATENALLAAATASGTTVLENAAREPEIEDLAGFLNACGACIRGAGESTIVVEGVKRLSGASYRVIPDRIEAATYLAAAAATGSAITLVDVIPRHLRPVLAVLQEAGCRFSGRGRVLSIEAPARLSRIHSVRTMPYPGFPTDAQAPVLAASTLARGTSIFVENIFEERYKHVGELLRMGASIRVDGRVAVVEGVERLSGARVQAADLRGGAGLLVAALAAQGETVLEGVCHLDRGYEHIEDALCALGAQVKRRVMEG